MTDLQEYFQRAHVGIAVSRRPKATLKVRLMPYCEIRHRDQSFLESLKIHLLTFSVSSTVRPGFIRIQGINNCNMITGFIDDEWWLDCMMMFMEKKHLTAEGIEEILATRNSHGRSMSSKVSAQEVRETMSAAST